MKIYTGLLILIFGLGIITSGCNRQVVQTSSTSIIDGRYDLAFPFGGNADALKEILKSVKLINATAYYQSYLFPLSAKVTNADINPKMLKEGGYETSVFNDFAVGTATIIYNQNRRIAVLTCDHVVNFADTLVTYYKMAENSNYQYIHRISFKKRERFFIADMRQGDAFEVIASDPDLDLAVLGKELLFPPSNISVFDYPLGHAEELEWGNLLYLIGFPSGKKMITTGIVSDPNRNSNHGFLVDALFNRGFSGGIALAIRDGYPNFELVGVVNAVSAENEVVLVPNEFKNGYSDLPLNTPYEGDIFASNRKKINYGISFGISIESIRNFLDSHRLELENRAFQVDNFFRKSTN